MELKQIFFFFSYKNIVCGKWKFFFLFCFKKIKKVSNKVLIITQSFYDNIRLSFFNKSYLQKKQNQITKISIGRYVHPFLNEFGCIQNSLHVIYPFSANILEYTFT